MPRFQTRGFAPGPPLRSLALCRAFAVASALAIAAACGGGSGGGNTGGNTGGNGGGTTPVNPCTTALTEDDGTIAAVGTVAQSGAPSSTDKKTIIDGDPRGRLAEALALNRQAQERRRNQQIRQTVESAARGDRGADAVSPAPVADDVGEIAVMQDTGDLVLPQNTYDVRSMGLRFTRNGSSYTLSKIDGSFRATLGGRVTLGDDDSAAVANPFTFPYYGTGQPGAFVNPAAHISLGEEAPARRAR